MLKYNEANIDFEITYNCNFRCDYCGVKPHLHNKSKEFNINGATDILEHFIDICKNTKIPIIRIYIAGGEPSTHKDFIKIYNTFYEILKKYENVFDEIWLYVPTNFTGDFLKTIKSYSKIKQKVTISFHNDINYNEHIKNIKKLNTMIQTLNSNYEIELIFLFADDYDYNNRMYNLYNRTKKIFKSYGFDIHYAPLIYYHENKMVDKRPNIKELKLCKPFNYIIDEDLNILDACKARKPVDKKVFFETKIANKLPRLCNHLCYDDHSRECYNKIFLYSDNKDFRYQNKVKDYIKDKNEIS